MKHPILFSKLATCLANCVLAVILTGPVLGQNFDLPYSSGSTGADGPFTVPAKGIAGFQFGLAYDAKRAQAVKFGGLTSTTDITLTNAQTWVYDGHNWQQKSPAQSPSTRYGCTMEYDAVRENVVLFGGFGTGAYKSDTWLWNGVNWTQTTPTTTPPARESGRMVWDAARGKIVMFGGYTSAGTPNLQDTWLWDGTDWELANPSVKPPARRGHFMAYHPPSQKVFMMGGYNGSSFMNDIWSWDGSIWANEGSLPGAGRFNAALVYDPIRAELLLHGGNTGLGQSDVISSLDSWKPGSPWVSKPSCPERYYGDGAVWHQAAGEMVVPYGNSTPLTIRDTTWAWDGYDWISRTGSTFMFDLRSKADAVWNFTTINIPSGTTVKFRGNAANNGVLWLASEDVTINGVVDVSGSAGNVQSTPGGELGRGGVGGFDGGAFNEAGKGPGGGAYGPNSVNGSPGVHADSSGAGPYGNLFAQPALGGSGGGGFSWVGTYYGDFYCGGGGGGGSLVIAGSRDITLNGSLIARGGAGSFFTRGIYSFSGGAGSGGLVRLVADRIRLGSAGVIDAGDTLANGKGRIRLEGYIRDIPNFANQVRGSKSQSVPVLGSVLAQAGGRLSFTKVSGANVVNPTRGDILNPDVVFTATGAVNVEVHALNVPDGTPVTVSINHSNGTVINLPAVPLAQCKAVFTATIPAGSGVMQAFATYNVGGPAPAP